MTNNDKILEFYDSVRHLISDGCIGLMSKDAFISKAIRWHDREIEGGKAEWSHVYSIFEKEFEGRSRLFVLDSNAQGVKPALLSDRIRDCDNFMILIPTCDKKTIEKALFDSFDRASKGIKYDYKNGIKELLNRRYGLKLKITNRDEHDICSDWCRDQFIAQGMASDKFISITLPFPADYDRYSNIQTVKEIRFK